MQSPHTDEAKPFVEESEVTIIGGNRRPDDVLEDGRATLLQAGAIVGVAFATFGLNWTLEVLRENRDRRN